MGCAAQNCDGGTNSPCYPGREGMWLVQSNQGGKAERNQPPLVVSLFLHIEFITDDWPVDISVCEAWIVHSPFMIWYFEKPWYLGIWVPPPPECRSVPTSRVPDLSVTILDLVQDKSDLTPVFHITASEVSVRLMGRSSSVIRQNVPTYILMVFYHSPTNYKAIKHNKLILILG